MSRADLDALIALAESHGCYLLVDETYRDLSYGQKLPAAASLSPRAISVSSLSKAFGIPGIRIGWLVTRDAALYEQFLAAKEQIGICGSVIDEAIARTMLEGRDDFLGKLIPEMTARRDIVQDWIDAEPLVDWVRPEGGVVGFPRLNVGSDFDLDRFYAPCSNGTAPMSARATGSTCRSGSSASASAGPRRSSSRAVSLRFRRRCGSDWRAAQTVLPSRQASTSEIAMNSGPQLSIGAQGADVVRAQTIFVMMKILGFDQIDGIFGTLTKNAVIDFQQSEGIPADGVIGNATWSKMPADPDTPVVKRGSKGSAVTGLQKGLLKFGGAGSPTDPGAADGDFGPRTEAAVKSYQTQHSLHGRRHRRSAHVVGAGRRRRGDARFAVATDDGIALTRSVAIRLPRRPRGRRVAALAA